MKLRLLLVISSFFAIPLSACAESQVEQAQPDAQTKAPSAVVQTAPATQTDPAKLLPNGKVPFAGVLVGGQPTPAQLETLAGLGYGTIVNLRSPQEKGQTDPAAVEALGMRYVSLPITGADSLSEQNANELAAILDEANGPVVVHCASGNRVGALFALEAYYVDGKTPDEALAIGKAAGVTRLEPVVKQKLGLE
jgi:uncharacterized protein (TIGR01244 family)